jgi:hypothetical protein
MEDFGVTGYVAVQTKVFWHHIQPFQALRCSYGCADCADRARWAA